MRFKGMRGGGGGSGSISLCFEITCSEGREVRRNGTGEGGGLRDVPFPCWPPFHFTTPLHPPLPFSSSSRFFFLFCECTQTTTRFGFVPLLSPSPPPDTTNTSFQHTDTQTTREEEGAEAPLPLPLLAFSAAGLLLDDDKKGRASRRRRRTGEREKRARANKAGHVISFEGGTPPHTARGQAAGFSTTQPAVCPKCVLSLSSATPHLPPFALARCFSSFGEIRTTPSSSPSSSLLCFRPRKIHTQQQQAS